MASRKRDIEVQDLARDEALAGQLRTGQPVSIVQRDSAGLQVLSSEGSLIGVIADLPSRQQLLAGSAVIRSLRKQQDLLVHVLLRVTHPEPNAAPQQAPSKVPEEEDEPTTRLKRAQLELLANSEDIRFQLKDKHFQSIIQHIDSSANSEKALKQALLQPDFRKLSDTILSVINPVQEQKPPGLRLPEQLQGSMFDIVESLQGPSRAAVDSDDDTKGQASSSTDKQQPAASQPAGRFSLWGMATALAENVKKSTADIAASVTDTDWRAELETFGKGVADDSHEAQEIMHKGLSSLESFPRQATAHLPAGLGAGLEGFGEHISGGVDPTLVQQRINKRLSEVGTGLRGIGTSMFTGTRELLEHVTEAISSELDSIEGMAARNKPQHSRSGSRLSSSGSSAKYSRLEAEISAMQRNSSTYCDKPEDSADYRAWLDTFDLAARKPDIDGIIAENAFMAELQARIVPLIVQYNDFWTRYFYQLHKLQQKHAQRQKLAQRAQATTEDEIAWDDDTPGPSPAASPQQPAKTERTPADKGVERVGARQSPPPPLPLVATVVSSAVAEGQDGQESADIKASSITAKGSEEHSDVETSTASEGSSGGAPWTVVTSPRKGSQDDEVTSQAKTAEPAASATPSKAAAEAPSGDSAPAAVAQAPGVPAAGAVSSPAKGSARDLKEDVPASEQKEAVQPESVAKTTVAAPKKPPSPAADDEDEDLEISDEEGLAAEGEGSEVDEDWGGDWE